MSLGFQQIRVGALSRISEAAGGAGGDGTSQNARFTADGASVIFESLATNLAGGDVNGRHDILMRDLSTGAITRLSTNWRGEIALGASMNGRDGPRGLVVFDSDAPNLVPSGDTNLRRDVFVLDRATGVSQLVSRSAAGIIGNNDSVNGVLSPDGTRVVFESLASNLVGADTNGARDLFVKTLADGAITRISAAADGTQANGQSGNASFSADGTKVLFESNATNLVSGDTNASYDVFLKDLTTGAVTRVSVGAGGVQSNGHSFRATFTPDGTGILFESLASNLVANDTNGARDIFLRNLITGVVTRVSEGAGGLELNGTSQNAMMAGNRVVFESAATNAVGGDLNARRDVFLKDLVTGDLIRLSTGRGAEGNGDSFNVRIAADGERFLFDGTADNLVARDSETQRDVFFGRLENAVRAATVSEDAAGASGRLFFDSAANLALQRIWTDAPALPLGVLTPSLVRDAAGPVQGEIGWNWVPGAGAEALAAGQTATETWAIRIEDVAGNRAVDTVTVTVLGANDAPVARPDELSLAAGGSITNLAALILANDTDVDTGDSVRITGISAPGLLGSIGFDPATGMLSYAATGAALGGLFTGETAIERLSYTITDASGANATAEISITVEGTLARWAATDGPDVIHVGPRAATVLAGAGDDIVYGSPEADFIDGGTGRDRLYGGGGNDIYIVDSLADRVVEDPGAGYDTVRTDLFSYRLPANVEVLEFIGSSNFEGTGNALGNRIAGGAAADYLDGLDDDDILIGGAGNDYLGGGAGNDRLDGGAGVDQLRGDAGADLFVMRKGEIANDRILDFSHGDGDRLLLAGWSETTSFSRSGSTVTLTDPIDGFRESFFVTGDATAADVLFG